MSIWIEKRFECLEQLDEGTRPHRVYLAHDHKEKVKCIVKVVIKGAYEPRVGESLVHQLQLFLRQTKVATCWESNTLVVPYHWGRDSEGNPYLVMRHHEGKLAEEISPFTEVNEVLIILRELVAGLKNLHEKGLVHRNITPNNIIINKERKPFIIGLTFIKDLRSSTTGITAAGGVTGTPGFLAPEQIGAREIDFRCDIFGLGATLYYLLAGQKPFRGKSLIQIYENTLEGTPPSVNDYRAEKQLEPVEKRIENLMSKMMAKDPQQRFASCDDLLRFLDMEFPSAQPEPKNSDPITETEGPSITTATSISIESTPVTGSSTDTGVAPGTEATSEKLDQKFSKLYLFLRLEEESHILPSQHDVFFVRAWREQKLTPTLDLVTLREIIYYQEFMASFGMSSSIASILISRGEMTWHTQQQIESGIMRMAEGEVARAIFFLELIQEKLASEGSKIQKEYFLESIKTLDNYRHQQADPLFQKREREIRRKLQKEGVRQFLPLPADVETWDKFVFYNLQLRDVRRVFHLGANKKLFDKSPEIILKEWIQVIWDQGFIPFTSYLYTRQDISKDTVFSMVRAIRLSRILGGDAEAYF